MFYVGAVFKPALPKRYAIDSHPKGPITTGRSRSKARNSGIAWAVL